MNKQEYLLVCLAEECAEVQKSVSKALRFGLADYNPVTKIDNGCDLKNEMNDIYALVELIRADCQVDLDPSRTLMKLKKAKVKKYMVYSRKLGILWEDSK